DGQWALAVLPGVQRGYSVLPTGAGQPKTLDFPAFQRVNAARWFGDGKRILIGAAEPERQERFWVYHVESAKVQPVTPEGTFGSAQLSSDEKFVLARCIEGGYCLYPVQ